MKHFILLILFGFLIQSCGSNMRAPTGKIAFSESLGSAGYIHLNISTALSPALAQKGTIEKYKIILESDGEAPLEQIVSPQAKGFSLTGLLPDKKYSLRVYALNGDDKILREGFLSDLRLALGEGLRLDIILQALPVALNLSDGDQISNKRLYFHLLSDPGDRLVVEENGPLPDIVSQKDILIIPESGIAKFFPGRLSAGDHHFQIQNLDNGKSTELNIFLWEGDGIHGAPLVPASNQQIRVGQSLAGREVVFPNISEALWNAP